jgi:hypothetical protein
MDSPWLIAAPAVLSRRFTVVTGSSHQPTRFEVVERDTAPVECVAQPFLVRADPAGAPKEDYEHADIVCVRDKFSHEDALC